MAASGYTPILLYASGTASNVPLAANLTSTASGAELALNYADGKLFYKDNAGVVQVLASKAGNVNVSSFSAGTTGFTPNTATTGAVTLGGTLATTNGGTGLTSFTANGVMYASSASALTTGTALTFDGAKLQVSGGDIRVVQASNSANNGLYFRNFADTNTFAKVAYDAATGNLQIGTTQAYDTIFLQNNAEAMRLTSTGLSITPDANRSFKLQAYGTYSMSLENPSVNTGAAIQFKTNGNFIWTQGASDPMVLTSTGLGIGTSTPGSKLETIGTITSNKNAVLQYLAFALKNSTQNYGFYLDQDNVGSNTFSLFDTTNAQTTLRYFPGASGYWQLYTNNAERMRLDASGNLGLGVTPSAWNLSGMQALQIKSASLAGYADSAYYSANAYFGSGAWRYINPAAAFQYTLDGAHKWFTSTGTPSAGAAISFNQAMTLDASGLLTVGNTSPAGSSQVTAYGASDGQIAVQNSTNWSRLLQNAGDLYIDNGVGGSAGNIIFRSSSSTVERARIDSSGNLIQSAPTTPPSLATNGTMVFNLTSNTNLRVSVRGSDGVTRTANITLA